jgi:hypothetical protein
MLFYLKSLFFFPYIVHVAKVVALMIIPLDPSVIRWRGEFENFCFISVSKSIPSCQKQTVKSGTTRRITPKIKIKNQKSALPVVSGRGHPRLSFVRPYIQSWNPATGCGA